MFLLASGSQTGAQVTAGGGGVYVTVTGTTNPLLFMRPKKGFVCVYSVERSGSTVTYAILSNCTVDGFDWYVFDTISPTASNFGLQVFGADGGLIFDSAAKPLLIKSLTVLPAIANDGTIGRPFTSLGTYDGTSILCLASPVSQLYRQWEGYWVYVQVFDVVRHNSDGTYGYGSGFLSAYGGSSWMFAEQWTDMIESLGPGKLIIADGRFL